MRLGGRADYILTEDRAMLRIKEHAGAKVLHVSEFSGLDRGRERQRKRPELEKRVERHGSARAGRATHCLNFRPEALEFNH